MQKALTIVHVASEIEPFSKSGGLANVIGALPRAHANLGHNVLVITPYYEKILNTQSHPIEVVAENVPIELSAGVYETVSYYRLNTGSAPTIYLVGHKQFFGDIDHLYGEQNENARFFLFDVAALQLLKIINVQPDVINCHDWHSGLIPYFLKGRYKKDPFWEATATLFTIHNLSYQLGHNWWEVPNDLRDNGRTTLPAFTDSEALERINFAKRAILNADAINAVSETYRKEIMTIDFGQELHRILKNREKIFFGIVNGIDYAEFNPMTDPGLKKHYSDKSVTRKKFNKKWLQRHYGLTIDENIPLICMTSRVVEQKGFKMLIPILNTLMHLNTQMIIMGDGDDEIATYLRNVGKTYPKQFTMVPFDRNLETSLYAGSDMFLLPSRFEPCGINQLIAMRYGCVPIVHHIGGLADTIIDYSPEHKEGNGFAFSRYTSRHLLVAISRALETYKHKRIWKGLIVSDLQQANSWLLPAEKYIDLYRTTMKLKKKFKALAEI